MKVLGISAFYHDSAAVIVERGNIIAAAQEERFTRIKHDASFPINAIQYCLAYSGLQLADLDAVAFYDKPLLKFERLLETYYSMLRAAGKASLELFPFGVRKSFFSKK